MPSLKFLPLTLGLAALSACTQGGDSEPDEPTDSVISGYAASGRALPAGSVVRAKCLDGNAETTTAENGAYSLNATDLDFPCLLQARFGSGESMQTLYSFAAVDGQTQVTPLTHASIARVFAETDPAAVFAAPSESQLQKLLSDLPEAQLKLRELLTEQDLATALAPVTGSFFTSSLLPATATAQGDLHDALLDAVMAKFGGTDALVFTLVTYVPGKKDTVQPPSTPKTGLVISPSPIVLGSLSYSFTTDEVVAATRLASITNHGPNAQPISPYFDGYQNGVYSSNLVMGERNDSLNQRACFEGLTLAVGATCWVRIHWKPGSKSQNVPLEGNLEGKFGVRIPNTLTELVSVPVRANLDSRSYIQGDITRFQASSGYKLRNRLTLTNLGDLTGSFSVAFKGTSSATGAFYEDPSRPDQKTCTGSLAPGESCTIPYVFCWGSALGEDERIRDTLIVRGSSVNTEVEFIASNRQSEPPRPCGGPFDEL